MTATKARKPKATKAKANAKAKADAMVTLSSVYAKHAARLNTDTTKAAKLVRAKLRSNFDEVCKLSPNVTKAKSRANDGNRWPTHITAKLAEYLSA